MRVVVTEIRGVPNTFTLKDGSTFRLFSRQRKEVSSDKISEEMKRAEAMGYISMTSVPSKKPRHKVEDNPVTTLGGVEDNV